jgi:hypothetical protein
MTMVAIIIIAKISMATHVTRSDILLLWHNMVSIGCKSGTVDNTFTQHAYVYPKTVYVLKLTY